jgi:hypothetical protein
MNDRGRRMDEKIKIFISKNVFERIQKLAADQNFNSADEYVEFILNEFIADVKNDDCSEISEPDEIRIKNRLRSLGYLE